MDVAAIQMPCDRFSVDSNLSRAADYLEYAAAQGAELVLLPELFSLGYSYEPRYGEFIETREGNTVSWLKQQAQRRQCHIGATFVEGREKRLFNTFVLACPNGQTHFYQKQHLPLFEKFFFSAGREDGIFQTSLGRIGVFVCWDITSSKMIERYRGKVDLVIIVSAWPDMTSGNIPILGVQGWTSGLAMNRPGMIASRLQVPVLCCNMAGEFRTRVPWLRVNYNSLFVPSTSLVLPHDKKERRLCRKEGVLLGSIPRFAGHSAGRRNAPTPTAIAVP